MNTSATDSTVQRFYHFHAPIYDLTRPFFLFGRGRAADALKLSPGDSVLEIGCGTGLNFPLLMARVGAQQGQLTGVDFSADMLRRAQKRITASGWPHASLIQADASELNLPGRFDAVIFGYSLTMISRWREAMARAVEHLKVGGRLVVLDFDGFHGWSWLKPAILKWLISHEVDTSRPYAEAMAQLTRESSFRSYLGGYYFVAQGVK